MSSNPYLRSSQLPWPMSSRGIARVFTHPQSLLANRAQVQDSGSLFLPMGLWLVAKTRWGTSQGGHRAHLSNTADTGMAVRLSGQCLTCRFTEDLLCSLQGCCHPRSEACLDKMAPRPRRSRKSLGARSVFQRKHLPLAVGK